ncbi:MAG: sulfite exporter TauE/SafE family protein [Bryobacteraceae bacterium]
MAAVAGFGIGSILTPVVAFGTGMKLGVSIVAVPHFIATLVRFLRLWRHVDRRVFWTFGMTNAAGALIGALLHTQANDPALKWLLAVLLLFAGVLSVFGYAERLRFGRALAWPAGAISGIFGGLVGNQGGIRSAAMLGLKIDREAFVATATASDSSSTWRASQSICIAMEVKSWKHWPIVVWSTIVIVGTFLGMRLLSRIPEMVFRRVVGAVLIIASISPMLQRQS